MRNTNSLLPIVLYFKGTDSTREAQFTLPLLQLEMFHRLQQSTQHSAVLLVHSLECSLQRLWTKEKQEVRRMGCTYLTFMCLIQSEADNHPRYSVYTWDTTAAMNGCLTGLVAITAGCATVEPWAAFVIGLTAGWIYLAASSLMIRLKIDDAVGEMKMKLGT
jgi:hypothetical protein